MRQQYVPLEKRSKREQREYHAAQRGSWCELNPVTRKPPNPKAYTRKKSGQRYEYEPPPGFFCQANCEAMFRSDIKSPLSGAQGSKSFCYSEITQ